MIVSFNIFVLTSRGKNPTKQNAERRLEDQKNIGSQACPRWYEHEVSGPGVRFDGKPIKYWKKKVMNPNFHPYSYGGKMYSKFQKFISWNWRYAQVEYRQRAKYTKINVARYCDHILAPQELNIWTKLGCVESEELVKGKMIVVSSDVSLSETYSMTLMTIPAN